MLGLAALPGTWKIAGAAIGALLIVLACVGLYIKGRSDGGTACEANVAKAVAKQQADDKALSNKILDRQKSALDALHAQALSSLQKVQNAPITSSCGPVQRDASYGVRAIVRGGPASP